MAGIVFVYLTVPGHCLLYIYFFFFKEAQHPDVGSRQICCCPAPPAVFWLSLKTQERIQVGVNELFSGNANAPGKWLGKQQHRSVSTNWHHLEMQMEHKLSRRCQNDNIKANLYLKAFRYTTWQIRLVQFCKIGQLEYLADIVQ